MFCSEMRALLCFTNCSTVIFVLLNFAISHFDAYILYPFHLFVCRFMAMLFYSEDLSCFHKLLPVHFENTYILPSFKSLMTLTIKIGKPKPFNPTLVTWWIVWKRSKPSTISLRRVTNFFNRKFNSRFVHVINLMYSD